VIASIWSTSRTEAFWLVGHLEHFNFHTSGVVSMHVPSFVAHVANGEKIDCTVAFAEDYPMIDIVLCKACVDRDIQ
jgi:hypothetical protein